VAQSALLSLSPRALRRPADPKLQARGVPQRRCRIPTGIRGLRCVRHSMPCARHYGTAIWSDGAVLLGPRRLVDIRGTSTNIRRLTHGQTVPLFAVSRSSFSSMSSTRMGRAPRTVKYRVRSSAKSTQTCLPRPISRPRTGKLRRSLENSGPQLRLSPGCVAAEARGAPPTSAPGAGSNPRQLCVRENDVDTAIRV
jgi:hypothetical protein